MDPLDREKPWGRLAQVVLITSVIFTVYFVFRRAVVVPEWGWRLILGGTAAGTLLYFYLMLSRETHTREKEQHRSRLRSVLAVMVVAALTLPVWVVLWLLATGQGLP